MNREMLKYLEQWKNRENRKPLVIRGARQVGKSFLVRMFAAEAFDNLAEINFERLPDAASLFASKSPKSIVPLLEARLETAIRPGKTILFLDEIQAAPEVFAALRYFYEEMPDLHIIAAGSLLEFVLQEHTFSMPVGRIEYAHLGPMNFEEFLEALGRQRLVEWLCALSVTDVVPESLHRELSDLVRRYCIVGGMPEAVASYAKSGSFLECERIQQNLLAAYRDDFARYGTKAQIRLIEKVFARLPHLVGGKFMFSRVDPEERSRDLGAALRLLCLSRVVHQVKHTAGNGVPLGSEANDRLFKTLFLDVGLLCRACGLGVADVESASDLILVNSGAVGEQFIGQHLLTGEAVYDEPALYYWMREKANSSAEVDYLVSVGSRVIPVEVKAGATGRLKSLRLFLAEKHLDFGLRFNSDVMSFLDPGDGSPRLLSLPFYLVVQARRLCREINSPPNGPKNSRFML